MTSKKHTTASVQAMLLPKLQGFKDSANAVREAHAKIRQSILEVESRIVV